MGSEASGAGVSERFNDWDTQRIYPGHMGKNLEASDENIASGQPWNMHNLRDTLRIYDHPWDKDNRSPDVARPRSVMRQRPNAAHIAVGRFHHPAFYVTFRVA